MSSPKQAALLGLVDGVLEDLDGQRILAADVDEPLAGPDGVGADEHSFEDRVGIALQHGAVHVGPRLAFVGIADHILGVGGGLAGQPPFLPGGKGRAPAAPQPGLDHLLDHRLGRHRADRPQGAAIGAPGDGLVQAHGIDRAAVPQDDLLLTAIEIQLGPFGDIAKPAGSGRVLVRFAGGDVFFACEAAQGQARPGVATRGVGGQQIAGLRRGHVGKAHPRTVGQHQIQKRLLRAEADAAGAADDRVELELLDRLPGGGLHGPRPMATPQLAEPTRIFSRLG